MRWLQSAIITTLSLIPLAVSADEPRQGDEGPANMRRRMAELQREMDREGGGGREGGMEPRGPEGERPPFGTEGGPGREGGPGGPGGPGGREGGPRAGGPGGPQGGPRTAGPGGPRGPQSGPGAPEEGGRRGPGGPGMSGGPRPPTAAGPMGPGAGGPEQIEEQKFQLRMKARGIEHQMQNLQWELETVRLQMQHLEQMQSHTQRPGGPGPQPGQPHGMQGPGPDGPRDGGPRAGGKEDQRRGDLKARLEDLRKTLEKAMHDGDREEAQKVHQQIERVMRALTGEAKDNVDRKRGDALEKIENRMREVKEQLLQAKEAGRKEVAKKLGQELEELQQMRKKASGGGEGDEKPKKKPRMI